MTLVVDWQVYYQAAKQCHDLAVAIRQADKPLHDAVKNECAGMAGDANGCKQWGEKYDVVARDTMQACTNLADALTNYGYVLYATGYNYGIRGKTNPAPDRPTVHAMSEYKVVIPSSVGNNGNGVDKHDDGIAEFYNNLVEKIGEEFGKLPNGDVGKLEKASNAWKTFSTHQNITGAEAQIATIKGLFDKINDKTNLPPIYEKLDALANSAKQINTGSATLAGLVGEYHTETVAARKSFESNINVAVASVGVAVLGGLALAAISFGGSLVAAGGAIGGIVVNCINAIRAAYTGSKLIRIVGLAAATATAAVTLKHFDGMGDLNLEAGKLLTILLMKVLIDDAAGAMGDQWTKVQGATPGSISITQGRRIHILDGDGDEDGGGHAPGVGAPGKTEFPDTDTWDDDHIIDSILDVARNPDQAPVLQDNGRWKVSGVRDGVLIEVIVDADGSVRTGYPVSGPGVVTNPK
ncbi:EndoU domain-containing protein [Nocardia sp. NPDC005998]|uniref:EndoU domain-containing protein n=1 Tax=Nocardia sp. NPDC005998 TaxID=3156894 RepID=UPI0033AB6484